MHRIISTFLLSLCCFASTDAFAHTNQAREAHVVIQSIDRQTRVLTLIYDKGRGPRKLACNADTKFLCDWKFVSAAELKEDLHVTVYYHSPFFGKPFVTKVLWGSEKQP